MEDKDAYEYDPLLKQIFCKFCGNNYLMHKHKDDCKANEPKAYINDSYN